MCSEVFCKIETIAKLAWFEAFAYAVLNQAIVSARGCHGWCTRSG